MSVELMLPSAAELTRFAITALDVTGMLAPHRAMSKRGERTGPLAEVRVCERLSPAHTNIDDGLDRYLEPFAADERPFVERQILRSHRPGWRCVLTARWTVDFDTANELAAGHSSAIESCIWLETPLLAFDRQTGLVHMQRVERYGAQDFGFVLRNRDGVWESEPWTIH